MNFRTFVSIVTAAILVPIGVGKAEPPPEADGLIVYATLEDDCLDYCDHEIFLAYPDGSDPEQLTENDVDEFDIVWSPDGRRLLFGRSSGQGGSDIWVMDANGSNPVNLTNSPKSLDLEPQWSPDGTSIIFMRGSDDRRGSTPRILSMRADGSDRTVLAVDAFDARWSPDGGLIAFRRHVDRTPLILMKPDGGNQRKLDNARIYDWSPDGRRLTYVRYATSTVGPTMDGTGSRQVRIVRADGTHNDLLGRLPQFPSKFEMLWSPADDRIAVGGHGFDESDLWIADPHGGVSHVRSYDPTDLDWSPSGTKLVYSRCSPDCDTTLYVKDFIGEDDSIAFGSSGPARSLDWQPDCTVEGTEASEVLEGTEGNDLICGFGGDDVIAAGGGDDVVLGGDGDDTLTGDGGADRLIGGDGTDSLRGGEGDDLVADMAGVDALYGGPGKDTLGSRDQRSGDRIAAGSGGDICRADPNDLKTGCPQTP